jgi:hypothetical protein
MQSEIAYGHGHRHAFDPEEEESGLVLRAVQGVGG